MLFGEQALCDVASSLQVEVVMAAIVGAAGLLPTLSAVESSKKVLLANKESLVMAGSIFMGAVHQHGANLLPIDSEHNAIFQCLPTVAEGTGASQVKFVEKIVLTASGGPFRTWPAERIAEVVALCDARGLHRPHGPSEQGFFAVKAADATALRHRRAKATIGAAAPARACDRPSSPN